MRDASQKSGKHSKRIQWTEIVDGVTVVHTGRFRLRNKGAFIGLNGKMKKLRYEQVEVLEYYDSNKNKFYTNCTSQKEAEEVIKKLEKEGEKAVIGLVAPDYKGRSLKAKCPEWVGVYIVK